MKTYTIEDLRKAFQAGSIRGAFDQAGNYFDAPLDEDEYIESLNPPQEKEELIPITYGQIKATCGWSRYCDITGANHYAINEGWNPSDTEIFRIPREQYQKLF